MIFRLGEWFSGTGGWPQGKALRQVDGFTKLDANAIRGIKKSAFAAGVKAKA